ncbi:hypothetical protein BS17DRAFT_773876 [Gyrodon lividus]|nr:hypothetical protein BS17DRAFT_791795 [Gyrodon lividus]KAF9227495.1 hypothetical protein BS17DRAFT_773876 [Gyrodon lividus]
MSIVRCSYFCSDNSTLRQPGFVPAINYLWLVVVGATGISGASNLVDIALSLAIPDVAS